MSQVQKVFIKPGGVIATLYKDETAPSLRSMGKSTITRASHVEPDPDQNGDWMVDLTPSGGPVTKGFKTRSAALEFEEKWLNERLIPTGSNDQAK
jgi:hypothetical protein